tara:strand:- start:4380 stop:4820 length:441 start_codon:yes stop_codon:yes gene_type:complete
MAIIDYIGIETAIKTLLNADSRTSGFTVDLEPEEPINEVKCPYVAIYLDNYETLLDTETIGGNAPYLTRLNIQVWCYQFSLENLDGATLRDDMLGKVKEVFKENKTLNDTVLYFQFGPGEFDTQKNTAGLGFFKGVSLRLQCEVKE